MGEGAVVNPEKNYSHLLYSYSGTAYVDNKEYSISRSNIQGYGGVWTYSDVFAPLRMYNPEGYVDNLSSLTNMMNNGVRYNYYRRDHLGNVREVWNAVRKNYSGVVKEAATTRQRTQYYPSGLPWAEGLGASVQKHKYNNKEFIEMHGLDEYDSQARWMYPAIMRTTTIDPLAEKYYSISPYAWCGNNPIRLIDPNGMAPKLSSNIKNNQNYGTMLILPNSYANDAAFLADYNAAKEKGIPIMTVDNIDDFKVGMQQLKDKKVSVNAYLISQHGAPGYASIGDTEISSETDLTQLKAGLNGKNVALIECDVTRGSSAEGMELIKHFSNQTNSNVVSADHLMIAGKLTDEPLNSHRGVYIFNQYVSATELIGGTAEGPIFNDFHLAKPNNSVIPIYDLTIRSNGTFIWNVTDTQK